MSEVLNHYEILGVGKDATKAEIRKAYLRLALKLHPDKQKSEKDRQDAHDAFTKMSNSHEVLSDPVKRAEYDMKQENCYKNYSNPGSFGGQSQTRSQQQPQGSTYYAHWGKQESGSENYERHRTHRSQSHKTGFGGGAHHGTSSNNAPGGIPKRSPPPGYTHRGSSQSGSSRQTRSSTASSGGTYSSFNRSTKWDNHQSRSSKSHGHGGSSDGSSQSRRDQTVFGKRQSDGEPCKRCINQGGYCYQHKHQQPQSGSESFKRNCHAHSSHERARRSPGERKSSAGQQNKVFGVRKSDGLPCKRCMKQGGYCFQHADQQRQKNHETHKDQRQRKSGGMVYGVRADGNPCMRCTKQGRFCYQHQHQAK